MHRQWWQLEYHEKWKGRKDEFLAQDDLKEEEDVNDNVTNTAASSNAITSG